MEINELGFQGAKKKSPLQTLKEKKRSSWTDGPMSPSGAIFDSDVMD